VLRLGPFLVLEFIVASEVPLVGLLLGLAGAVGARVYHALIMNVFHPIIFVVHGGVEILALALQHGSAVIERVHGLGFPLALRAIHFFVRFFNIMIGLAFAFIGKEILLKFVLVEGIKCVLGWVCRSAKDIRAHLRFVVWRLVGVRFLRRDLFLGMIEIEN
jgi:hypothetical protein